MTNEERIAELEAALRPFVAVAKAWLRHEQSEDFAVWRAPMGLGRARVSYADVRRAVKVLETTQIPLPKPARSSVEVVGHGYVRVIPRPMNGG